MSSHRMVRSGRATPSFVNLAAHPLRWRLLTALTESDYRVREQTQLVGEPPTTSIWTIAPTR